MPAKCLEQKYFAANPTCSTCKAGGVQDGGVSLVDGKCQAWCSNGGYCGTGSAYKTSGSTDCRTKDKIWLQMDLGTEMDVAGVVTQPGYVSMCVL